MRMPVDRVIEIHRALQLLRQAQADMKAAARKLIEADELAEKGDVMPALQVTFEAILLCETADSLVVEVELQEKEQGLEYDERRVSH